MRLAFLKKNIYKFIVLLLFILATSFIAQYHEYWADEAHAWLLARDASIFELFTKYLHSDGHPILWHLVIKFFQFLGLSYDNFNFISFLFSSLGVSVFLFKSKFKWYIKFLLPFTYFIFFQYTVVSRGYSLLFFLLSCLAAIWESRSKYYVVFTILLLLLLSSEVYMFLVAGSIYFLELIDYLKHKKTRTKVKLVCLIILFFSFLMTAIYVFPYSTNTFNPISSRNYIISDSFITSFNFNNVISIIISILLVLLIIIVYLKKNNFYYFIQSFIIIFPVISFMQIKYYNLWHLGIPFLIFIFIVWIQKLHQNKIIIFILLFSCIFQTLWSFSSSWYDINNSYSPVNEVVKEIKKYDYKNLVIYGSGFYDSSYNPYFEKNIYSNWNREIGFFYWDTSNIYYDISIAADSILNNNIDILIVSPLFTKRDYSSLLEYYNMYEFSGATYFQNFVYEDMTTYIYVRKELDVNKL